MIAYQDFAPKILQNAGMFKSPVMEAFDDALAAANAWILASVVKVVTIETVVLPNIRGQEGTTDVNLGTTQGNATWHQFIRVWYEKS